MKTFWIKIKSWEFWPFWMVYIPIFFIWLIASIRLRSFFFFSVVNPKIEMGGFAGESKIAILNQIPKAFIPPTVFCDIKKTIDFEVLLKLLLAEKINFPCIAKPNVGERGLAVKVCETEMDLKSYFIQSKTDFIVQSFVAFKMELAVLYYKMPESKSGTITSICLKEFLSVYGNGKDTIKALMLKNERALLQLQRFEKEQKAFLSTIPKKDEYVLLEPIGNHSRGTTFLDRTDWADQELIQAFDALANQIDGFHYGRFDLKCKNVSDLKKLQHFAILELNGVSAEPAHIYEPGFSFLNAQKVLVRHWFVLYTIAKQQILLGIKPMSMNSALHHISHYKKTIALQTK